MPESNCVSTILQKKKKKKRKSIPYKKDQDYLRVCGGQQEKRPWQLNDGHKHGGGGGHGTPSVHPSAHRAMALLTWSLGGHAFPEKPIW